MPPRRFFLFRRFFFFGHLELGDALRDAPHDAIDGDFIYKSAVSEQSVTNWGQGQERCQGSALERPKLLERRGSLRS